MMLPELRALLAACPRDADLATFRLAVERDNLLGKGTLATRKASFRQLRELYALDPAVPLFRALRTLWDADSAAQPLLALLCAAARDPLLRATAEPLSALAPDELVETTWLADLLERAFPGRYKASVRAVTARNLLGTWRQAGFVAPAPSRARVRPAAQPAATTYALLLGHLEGARGDLLFETLWARLVGQPVHTLREQAAIAGRRGWLEYRHAGGVTEITFRELLAQLPPHAEAGR